MKILMLGNAPQVHGGITSVIEQIKSYDWSKKDIEIKYISSYSGGNNIKKILCFCEAFGQVVMQMIFNKPNVIYMHMSHHGSFDRKNIIHHLARVFNVPDAVHLHGSEFQSWYDECDDKKKLKVRRFLQTCGALIVLGKQWNERIKEIEPQTRTVIINNTVHIPDKHVIWQENQFNVLFLGVLVKRKGVSDLLDAVNILNTNNLLGNMRFIIAGAGEEEERLKEKVHQLNNDSYVDFVGWAVGEKKMQLLEECQMMVLPSHNEGLPIAVLEAISYGMPVVATNVGDMSAAIEEGYNGFLIEPGDSVGLAEKISFLHDKNIYCEYSKNARELAQQKFSDEKYFEMLSSLMYSLVQ